MSSKSNQSNNISPRSPQQATQSNNNPYVGAGAGSSSTPPQMTFEGHIADAETNIISNGFTTTLYVPEFGWSEDENEASTNPFPAQMLAAEQMFIHLFASKVLRAWVHLAAEMQAGKTGVITALIRLVLMNHRKLNIHPDRIFVVTGMNDKAWRKQTSKRLPKSVRHGVYHNSTLVQFANKLRLLRRDKHLSNILVFVDESHIASSRNNQPNKHIYQTLNELCPRSQWQEHNIRVVTISATDPAKVLAVKESELPSAIVRLQTSPDYQSVERLNQAGRIRYLEDFGDAHTKDGFNELKRIVSEFNEPRYHIIRARPKKVAELRTMLQTEYPDAQVIQYDAEAKANAQNDASTISSEKFNDINELLSEEPSVLTFIILKNMFYAAKTLDDSYVGVLWDRVGSKDDTNLQSLLGRACGYGKSKDTVIYASKQTVDNYLAFWKELCSNPKVDTVLDVPATKVDKKMPGMKASFIEENKTRVSTTSTTATPYGCGIAYDPQAPEVTKQKANEDYFHSEWKKYKTFEEAKSRAPRSRASINEDGFYECSGAGKKQVLTLSAIKALQSGKKTANMDWKGLEIGESHSRMYVCYKDINDSTSAVFFVRTLTRLR